ncbi:DUF1707 and DUF4870 domain-containing protein [Kribbella qitaiheensis]|uniref:DUF1707 and DUF4870 domain-containing protein n=1 Tax=Kribbella qitaiheensis TaxID=1544730 RepID=A0A7G6X4F3_9ACTN|nr:DUF1707 and DUF4870 domain-containing protein [Kribbella qitaiheensis]QNE21118.1 DUF1707 and DUF4870 domain-containing protein [Kribbella qitaiheensis]
MSTSDLLVTPAQRDRAVEILQEMYADGRLDHGEFDTRIELALKSRTRAELNGTFDGLVSRPVPTYAPAAFTRPAPLVRTDSQGRGMGSIAHWLGYPTFFVGPALMVASSGKSNPAVRKHAVEALNFQLTAFAAFATLGIVTSVVGFAGFLFPLLGLLWFVLTGVGGLATLLGSNFRYPFTLRLVR